MAVSPGAAPSADALGAGDEANSPSGRVVLFRIDPRRSLFYRVCRTLLIGILRAWFRPRIRHRDRVPTTGPAIIAPVHRSNVDFAFSALLTRRKLFFMAKEELWKARWFGRLLEVWGVFPVRRSGADRESVRRAEDVLRGGHLLVMFPEGARQSGATVGELMEGVAFLAARTGATIVPVGISGSDRAMPKGAKFVKPVAITVSVGEPITPVARDGGQRVTRSQIHELSAALRVGLQAAYDDAVR